MWRPTLRIICTVLYWGLPITFSAIGVYLTHRSLAYDGPPAARAYVIGMMLIFGTWSWTAVVSARRRAESNAEIQNLIQLVDRVVADHETIRGALQAHDATAEILDALHVQAPEIPHRRGSDDTGQVIPLDKHSPH